MRSEWTFREAQYGAGGSICKKAYHVHTEPPDPVDDYYSIFDDVVIDEGYDDFVDLVNWSTDTSQEQHEAAYRRYREFIDQGLPLCL